MEAKKKTLVVGGGIAGMTAARELSNLGLEVLLIEKGAFLGGHAAQFGCKATDRCLKCNNCLVEERLQELSGDPNINIMLQTAITSVEQKNGRFVVSLAQAPQYIDPQKCTNCGKCFDKCPESAQGAILQGPSYKTHPFYAINEKACHFFKDRKARICQDICPEGAIDLDRNGREEQVQVEGVVLATGYQPFDPREKPRFNFEGFPNMITGLELERMFRDQGGVFRPSDRQPVESVAFVQCVGSRDLSLDHNFCSRVCCGYALRMALRITHEWPQTRVTVFYMDIQNFGKDFDRYMQQAQSRIRLVRSMPGDFYPAEAERITVRYFDLQQRANIKEDFDLVVLSVGIMPAPQNQTLSQMLELPLNQFGFLANQDGDSGRGVVVAGTAEGPMDISESITHAKRAALDLARYLGVIP